MVRLRAKNLDFIEAEKRRGSKENGRRIIRSILFLLPLLLLLFLLNVYSNRNEKMMKQSIQIQELETYLNSEPIISVQKDMELLETELEKLKIYQGEVDAAEKEMTGSVVPGSEDIMVIERAAGSGVAIIWSGDAPVRYENGVLYFEADASLAKEASAYVKRLTETDRFAQVSHTGIKRRESEDGGEVVYHFLVSCWLKASKEEGTQS